MSPGFHKSTVIIAGSGVTGLTFALMMQALGVDYVLLEAYGSCTPNVGASMVMQPQGLRVLHQLGLWEDIQDAWQPLAKTALVDHETGKMHFTDTTDEMRQRHGYGVGLFNRYDLVSILHNHIREKSRLLVNQKVVRIDGLEDKVVVHTAAGDVFEAQMIVGADGVHSAVRREMWRNAEMAGPGAIPEEDKKEITCDWATCFGASSYNKNVTPGSIVAVAGDNRSAAMLCGKGGSTFTFWTFRMPKELRKCTYDTIPRFTDEDHQQAIETAKEWAAKTPRTHGLEVDFAELFDRRDKAHSGITALPHFVLQKWHFGRIVVIGDAAHKFNPLEGQGGMNCIVSAATLVNCLRDSLGHNFQDQSVWGMSALDKAFTKLESIRVAPVQDAVRRSEESIHLCAWSTPMNRLWFKALVPVLPNSFHADESSHVVKTGRALDGWPVPDVAHTIPYADELERLQKDSKVADVSAGSALTMTAAALIGVVFIARAIQQHPVVMHQTLKAGKMAIGASG